MVSICSAQGPLWTQTGSWTHPIPETPLTTATFLTSLGLSSLLPNLTAGATPSHQPPTSPNLEDFERMLSFISNAFKKKVQE